MLYLQIIAGFLLLMGGAEVLVRGSVAVARSFGISTLVIGMTVVALGTSAPELIVALQAALSGAEAMAVGNVVGSNIANVLLVLGVAGMIRPIMVKPRGFYGDSIVLVGGSLLFAGLCWRGVIGLGSGLLLLAAFLAFGAYSYWRETRGHDPAADTIALEVEEMGGLPRSVWAAWLMVAGGLGVLLYGADILVEGGVAVARAAGVSDEVIGLTLIALGTSLPELAASAVAAWRGHVDVALGNVFGSNLFNILGIAGIVAVVAPLPVPPQIAVFDLWVMLATTALLIPFLMSGWRLNRGEAGVLVTLYGAYIGIQAWGVSALLPVAG